MFILAVFVLLQPLQAQKQEGDKDQGNNQEEAKQDTLDRLYFGGYMWARFSNFETRLEVSPQMGYHVTERLDAGVGGKYMYYYFNSELAGTGNLSSHIFGGSVFTSYIVIQNMNKILPFNLNGRLVAHLEYEALNMPHQVDITRDRSGRFWSQNYFVGGGLRQQLGKRAFISFLLLYNLNEKSYTPYYNNPMIRISFGF